MEELHDVQLTEIKPLLTGQVSTGHDVGVSRGHELLITTCLAAQRADFTEMTPVSTTVSRVIRKDMIGIIKKCVFLSLTSWILSVSCIN